MKRSSCRWAMSFSWFIHECCGRGLYRARSGGTLPSSALRLFLLVLGHNIPVRLVEGLTGRAFVSSAGISDATLDGADHPRRASPFGSGEVCSGSLMGALDSSCALSAPIIRGRTRHGAPFAEFRASKIAWNVGRIVICRLFWRARRSEVTDFTISLFSSVSAIS